MSDNKTCGGIFWSLMCTHQLCKTFSGTTNKQVNVVITYQ
jgi:hypothetical protein